LMPVAGKYGYDELITACREYTKTTGRRITFEYMLINGKNDDMSHADSLAANLKGLLCHVNLIPANHVKGKAIAPSPKDKAEQFLQILTKKGIAATVRRGLGRDIEAACGQLRLSFVENDTG